MKLFLQTITILALAGVSRMAQADSPTPATPQQQPPQVRYETGRPNPLPIPACEFHAAALPRQYSFKMPAQVTIRTFNMDAFKNGTAFALIQPGPVVFQGTLDKPKKLEPGYYVIDVVGEKEPIYVAYDLPDMWQFYQIHRQPGDQYMGPFLAPAYSRLQVGQYTLQGFRFQFPVECRNNETATFDVPVYEKLPEFLVTAQGSAW